jgi:Ca2+-binding EF-hand superfamily protein
MLEAFWKYGYKDMSEWTLDGIFSLLDSDGSGLLSFDEFLVPSIDPMVALNSNDKMWIAFKDMEIGNKGFIITSEIKAVLSPHHEIFEHTWRNLLELEPDEPFNVKQNIN